MEIIPVAHFHSPFTTKFGIQRQSGLVEGLRGRIVFEPEYRSADALRGLDGFDYLWMIWGFSANIGARKAATVRPPRLGGNVRMGVFATRSPFRPNNLGLSSVRIESIEHTEASGPVVHVSGADLMDGTPIYRMMSGVCCHRSSGVRLPVCSNSTRGLIFMTTRRVSMACPLAAATYVSG